MALFRSRGFAVAGLLYAAVSLLCTGIPLLNYLGYEFSALIGLLGSILAALLTIPPVRQAYLSPADGNIAQRVRTAFRQALGMNASLLTIPLVTMLTNALFVRNCSLLQGLSFFLLIPVVSVVFGTSLGLFCAVHYRFPRTAALLYALAFLLYSGCEGYFTPAIFSYNFLYGYFPGLTYDEVLNVSWPLVVFRVLTLLAGGLLIRLTVLLLRHTSPGESMWRKGALLVRALAAPARRLSSAAVLAGLLLVWFFRGELGLESTSGFIRAQLGSRFTTEHFIIHYSQASYSGDEIRWVAAEHEFLLHQVAGAFYLTFHGTIESYVYPSSQVKQRLIGTGTTNIAKPWSGQVHITKQSLDATLKHELVHVVAGQFGLPVIRASMSTGMVEGLAMAVEWDWGNRTLHQYAAAMRRFGVMPDIESLMGLTGFATQSSSVSYVLCGSFSRYLIDRYGMRKMMQVYGSGDYPAAFGRTLHQLIGEWKGFLDRLEIREQDRDAIDVIFRRPPIFGKVCARVLASRNLEARRLYEGRSYLEAEALYRRSFDQGRGYEALSGLLASALRAGEPQTVVAVWDSIIMRDPTPSQYLPLFMSAGDGYWMLGDTGRAEELYERVRRADLSLTLNEASVQRTFAVRDGDAAVRSWFLAEASDAARLRMAENILSANPDDWLFRYIEGRLLQRMMRYEESLNVLSEMDLASKDPLLEALRRRTMGYDLFRLGRFDEARTTFWSSLNNLSTDVAAHEVYDWVDRCEWMERHWK